jgi:putative acetyltransferase
VPLRIERDDLTDPAVVALLEEHVAELRSISPPESTHALDLAALRAEGVDVWVARESGPSAPPLGCVALTLVEPGHGELKSMRTAAGATGRGVGTALLEHVLDQAGARGLSRVSLETGAEDFFAPARRLYLRHGFEVCAPFGRYRPDPLSVFMTRSLP